MLKLQIYDGRHLSKMTVVFWVLSLLHIVSGDVVLGLLMYIVGKQYTYYPADVFDDEYLDKYSQWVDEQVKEDNDHD